MPEGRSRSSDSHGVKILAKYDPVDYFRGENHAIDVSVIVVKNYRSFNWIKTAIVVVVNCYV